MAGLVPFNKRNNLRSRGFENFYDVLDDFFNDSWLTGKNASYGTFKVDVQESENEYSVDAELPGVVKEEIDVRLDDSRLCITVQRSEKNEEEQKNYIHKEIRSSAMERVLYLQDAKSDGIKAKLEKGILNIKVPKKDKDDRTIKIDIE
ncbi:MAG: Molecular chaperone (Small heat shock protein) [Clostridiales bacterium 38_11]|nr:MAG: Molecular chaperone (Small heat shock protein) [Clostridiales bacterium 38_11]HBH13664.1 heat-shock protein Hsp20 [Clostridiales bacterium]